MIERTNSPSIFRMNSSEQIQIYQREQVQQPTTQTVPIVMYSTQTQPMQPMQATTVPPPSQTTVLQPILIPQASNNSLDSRRPSVDNTHSQDQLLTVSTARLGDLYVISIGFSIIYRPVNAYCNICRSVNVTYTEKKAGCCAYPLFS